MSILSVNVGSSSLKFALYACTAHELGDCVVKGQIENLQAGGQPQWQWQTGHETQAPQTLDWAGGADGHSRALAFLQDWLSQRFQATTLHAIAHRVVHGGGVYHDSVVVDADVLTQLRQFNRLAPLHQPHNLAGIERFQAAFAQVPQVACFDTAFHAELSPLETTFAIPAAETAKGIRRYGFHGLSYQFVNHTLQQASARAHGKMLLAHLGSGSSLCAIAGGKSIATSMGFTALDGLVMGSRSGYLDAGVLLHWLSEGKTAADIETLLYKRSGLLGVSGLSADMRVLRQSDEPQAQFAADLFAYRVVREAGALTACLGGLDVLCFTAGIGEHDAVLRQQVCDGLGYLGVRLDAAANQAPTQGLRALHAPDSAVEIWVCPTDEGAWAAQEALRLLATEN